MMFVDSIRSEPHQRSRAGAPAVRSAKFWRSLRQLWCRHRQTAITPKINGMPAHVVCQTCGWREPVMAGVPQGTRTWDSSRDEERYLREKKRRETVEEQRQLVVARLATPEHHLGRRAPSPVGNVIELKRAVGE